MEAWSNWCRTDSSEVLSGLDPLLDRISIRFSTTRKPSSPSAANRANLESAMHRAHAQLPGNNSNWVLIRIPGRLQVSEDPALPAVCAASSGLPSDGLDLTTLVWWDVN